MRKAAFALALVFIASAARASPVLYSPATGPPNVVHEGRSGFWSEPPDLNGLIASSEQILAYGFETEVANDFVLSGGQTVALATWWGGYFNGTPCVSGITTPGFNLRFYADAGCTPGELVADISVTSFAEQSLGCQAGSLCPLFQWTAAIGAGFSVGRYWFAPQMKDHIYPPQAGRLASGTVRGCGSFFRGSYLGYPNWTPVGDAIGVEFDCSQEFDCMICDGSSDVDELPATRATEKATWGSVKALFR